VSRIPKSSSWNIDFFQAPDSLFWILHSIRFWIPNSIRFLDSEFNSFLDPEFNSFLDPEASINACALVAGRTPCRPSIAPCLRWVAPRYMESCPRLVLPTAASSDSPLLFVESRDHRVHGSCGNFCSPRTLFPILEPSISPNSGSSVCPAPIEPPA
jgi:hypothetical protein